MILYDYIEYVLQTFRNKHINSYIYYIFNVICLKYWFSFINVGFFYFLIHIYFLIWLFLTFIGLLLLIYY